MANYNTQAEYEAHLLLKRYDTRAITDSPDEIIRSADRIIELAERIRKEREIHRPVSY
jgi:hypothetical protein